MEYASIPELMAAARGILVMSPTEVEVKDAEGFRTQLLDRLVWTAVFAADPGLAEAARWVIWEAGLSLGTRAASIQGYYEAKSRGLYPNATVPANNLRGLTYDAARALYRAARANAVGAVICEIARSEMDYTRQRPGEYATVVLAAAMRERVDGPIFIQGDHFQVKAEGFRRDRAREMESARQLIREALAAGFYNIDVDTSTLVDLSRPTVRDQQRDNFTAAAELTHFVRAHEPDGVTVSVGAEIGEVGGKNSTVEEFDAFMEGYLQELDRLRPDATGISKISVQTGTSHGGVVLPDGSIAEVALDFKVLEDISRVAREKYGMAGAVQHGASTLPESAFDRFPRCQAAEIHLATAYQNLTYDSPHLPADLKRRVYGWLAAECAAERKPKDTDEQFYYRTRKKGFGPFKREIWSLPAETRQRISAELETRFDRLFKKLNVQNTRVAIEETVRPLAISRPLPARLEGSL